MQASVARVTKPSVQIKPSKTQIWHEVAHQRTCVEELSRKLGISKLDDWYKVRTLDFQNLDNGKKLLSLHNYSLSNLLAHVYPTHQWLAWRFNAVPHSFWDSYANQRTFLDWVMKQLKFESMDDWYNVKTSQLERIGARKLLSIYSDSLYTMLSSVYPEHNWIAWQFHAVSKGYWNSPNNQKQFLDWCAHKLNIKNFEDWYNVKEIDLISLGGGNLLKMHRHSLWLLLSNVYKQVDWKPWKFSRAPRWYWQKPENIHHFVQEISDELSIKTLNDWYRVSARQVIALGGRSLIAKYGSLSGLLKEFYPDHPWNYSKLTHSVAKKSSQRLLYLTVSKIFPQTEILEDYIHPSLKLQLDIYVPSHNLAFEYQGKQHYEDVHSFSPQRLYAERDMQKRKLCEQHGIRLIEVPYWWDRTRESLLSAIKENKKL